MLLNAAGVPALWVKFRLHGHALQHSSYHGVSRRPRAWDARRYRPGCQPDFEEEEPPPQLTPSLSMPERCPLGIPTHPRPHIY